MKNQKSDFKREEVDDVLNGLALAITLFSVSIFLFFQKDYFGFLTNPISIVCIFFGIVGMGFELDKINKQKIKKIINFNKYLDISKNLNLGVIIFIIWAVAYRAFPIVWFNTLIAPLLCLFPYFLCLAFANLIVFGMKYVRTPNANERSDNQKLWVLAFNVLIAISGIIGFIASLIQILQYFKIL